MIKVTPVVSHIRFYEEENVEDYTPYTAICSVLHESPDTIWIKGFHGNVSRKLYKELATWIVDNNIKLIKANRAESRNIPFTSFRDGDYIEVEVNDVFKKWVDKRR